MLHFNKKKNLRITAALLLVLTLYTAAGFMLVPKLLRNVLLEKIPRTLHLTPAVGEIHFNPWLFQLEIRDFSLAANAEQLVGCGRLFVDFELSSLWRRAYSFANIEIDAPFMHAVVTEDGNLNLLLLKPSTSTEKPSQKKPLPPIRIDLFKISKGSVTYEDRRSHSAFATRLEPIDFELVKFTTGISGGQFTFSGASKLGERVQWHGNLSVQPIESNGEFQIDGLHAQTVWEYLKDRLNFVVNSGMIDVHATYQFSLRDAADLNAAVSKVSVNNLTVKPKESDADWITVPSLLVSGATVNLSKQQAHVDSVSLTGLKLLTWLEPDGALNLLRLAQPLAMPIATIPAAQSTDSSASAARNTAPAFPWVFDVGDFTLREASISTEDRSTLPAAKVLLAPFSLEVQGASSNLAKVIAVKLDTRINDSGSLKISGDVTPQPLSARLALKADGIDLKPLQPYIAEHTSMTLQSGHLSADTEMLYGGKKSKLQLTGNIGVTDLHTIDNALHDDFINWGQFDILGVNFQHDPDRLDVEQVVARKLYARVMVEPDASLNVTRVLAGRQPPGAQLTTADTQGALTSVNRPKHTGSKAVQNQPARGAATMNMPVAIKKIVLHASQANFADLSVQPNFSAGIKNLEGTVSGLSSKTNSRAKVDLRGSVDTFSPVAITGEVNVLGASLYTDLTMNFRNMELSTFNPYSGKFVGYNITKGKLTTELHYKVRGRKLDAQHHISIDQLEFGDKTASKEAVSLPVKLAVALLKDRNGLIDLDIPVNGTFDDPTFRVGPVVWKVFVNLLEKAVSAPFSLLGALFGGGPDLQFIDFRPGVADLDSVTADKGRAIAKALNERPQLKLEIPIAWVSELDRPALVETQFLAQIREAQLDKAGHSKPTQAVADYAQLDASTKVELLTQLYKRKMGSEPIWSELPEKFKTNSELMAAKVDFLSRILHQRMAITDADLTALGQQRAAAIQQLLLTDTQVDPARVFLVANDRAKNQDGKVRLELSLQ